MTPIIELRDVDADNWRACADLEVAPGDQSGWIGGLVIDQARQRKGFGRAAVEALTRRLLESGGCGSCALSYSPGNAAARDLYRALGFVETGEIEDDELVARLSPTGR